MSAGKRNVFTSESIVSADLLGLHRHASESEAQPGPVERGVTIEIDGLASQARPGLAQVALALARIMDNPRAVNQQPAAAKVLGTVLEKLRGVSTRGRRGGGLAVVRDMTEKGGT